MTIDIYKFNEQVEIIKSNLQDYEFVVYDTVSAAKNVSFYWNDGYTQSFFTEIDKEIQFTNDLVNALYCLCFSLMSISMLYTDINQKKKSLLGSSDNIINLNYFTVSSDDEEEIASRKRYLYNKVIDVEDRIASLLSRVDVPFIRQMSFNNLSVERPNQGFIGMLTGIDKEIQKLQISVQSAKKNCDVLKENLYLICETYNSKNSSKIRNIVTNFEKELQTLNFNLENAIEYIVIRKNAYENVVNKIAKEAEDLNLDN